MNILGICLSPGKGGLELYAHKTIVALHQTGHDCHFALSPDSYLSQDNASIKVIRLQPWWRHFPLLTAWQLARYIDKQEIELIHMHWNKDLNLAALGKLLSKRKPKLVYSRHMGITRSKKDFYHRVLYGQVDRMLVNAKFVLEQAVRYLPLPQERIVLLYLGVAQSKQATPQECNDLIPKSADRPSDFVIGLVGRIERGKGQHLLIEAVAELHRGNTGFQVILAGPVMDETYFESLMQQVRELGLADDVQYVGVSGEPDKLMSCCDVVVLTTYCETFGLVLVEAMRAGVAVIGSNAGGVPEIIRHNETGMLFASGNSHQLATCLNDLMHDEAKRQGLAQAGKVYADTMFDENKHFNALETIFSHL